MIYPFRNAPSYHHIWEPFNDNLFSYGYLTKGKTF